MNNKLTTPTRIFIAYSSKDLSYLEELLKHFKRYERNNTIEVFHDGIIEAGAEWDKIIKDNLYAADIILLLVSANFTASDYCYNEEMHNAIKLHEEGKAQVIPIILSHFSYEGTPFAKLNFLPHKAKPISDYGKKKDSAYTEIVEKLAKDNYPKVPQIRKNKEKPPHDSLPPDPTVPDKSARIGNGDLLSKQIEFGEKLKTADTLFDKAIYAKTTTAYSEAKAAYIELHDWEEKKGLEYTNALPHVALRILQCRTGYSEALRKENLDRIEANKLKSQCEYKEKLKIADTLYEEANYAEALKAYIELKKWDEKNGFGYTSAHLHVAQRITFCRNEVQTQPNNPIDPQHKPPIQQNAQLKKIIFIGFVVSAFIAWGISKWVGTTQDPPSYKIKLQIDSLLKKEECMKALAKYKEFKSQLQDTIAIINSINNCDSLIMKRLGMEFVQGGTFEMGNRDTRRKTPVANFYMSKHEITLAQFKEFIDETKYKTRADSIGTSMVWDEDINDWKEKKDINWRHDAAGALQTNDKHPVMHVSWNDAVAYCEWLSRKITTPFRLSTEAEWEYAAGNGSEHTKYAWGNGSSPTHNNGGNVADETLSPKGKGWVNKFTGYNDGYYYTSPVGLFGANKYGLYDMTGNVWEWCQYQNNSDSAVVKGGSWDDGEKHSTVFLQNKKPPTQTKGSIGFRVVRSAK